MLNKVGEFLCIHDIIVVREGCSMRTECTKCTKRSSGIQSFNSHLEFRLKFGKVRK